MTTHPPDNIDGFRNVGVTFFITRIYEDLRGRAPSPAEFVAWQSAPDSSMRRHYARGVRYFEIGNEPNLAFEGLRSVGLNGAWGNGAEFGQWFLAVLNGLRLGFPDAKFGFPGLSPGGDLQIADGNRRVDWRLFMAGARDAMLQADWIGCHCYEVFNTTDRGAGGAWRTVRAMFPESWLAITEFSSPGQNLTTQARQYRAYYEQLRTEPKLFGAFSFCSYGDSFQHEGWRTRTNTLTPIPAEVGRRVFGQPVTKPYALLGSTAYDAYVDGVGAWVRDLAGNPRLLLKPNDRVKVYSQPFDLPGLPNRVLISPEAETHVLAKRLVRAVAPGALLTWPTDSRVVTQRWAARPEVYAQWNLAGHEGIDLRAGDGANVYAAHAGEVTLIATGGNYGRQIRIRGDVGGRTLTTVYAHLQEFRVSKGDNVRAGQLIGLADSSGNTDGPHLHLGLKVEGEAPSGFGGFSNPERWLGI
jgi:murein DD-endopeptidase MepM/ murein hydrolase activator NlpD